MPGNTVGSDLSGTVVKIGSDAVTNVQIGDTVSTFVHGGIISAVVTPRHPIFNLTYIRS